MSKVLSFSLLFIVSSLQANTPIKKICNTLNEKYIENTNQLPIDYDYMTSLVGRKASMQKGICTINYSWLIKANYLVNEFATEIGWSFRESESYLLSSEGKEVVAEVMRTLVQESFNQTSEKFRRIVESNEAFKIQYSLNFDDNNFGPLVISPEY